LDNTLFDWVYIWHQSFKAMLDRLVAESGLGVNVLESDFRTVHQRYGTSEYAFAIEELPSLRARYPEEDLAKRFEGAIADYRSARKAALQLYPDVLETLNGLQARGCLLVGYTESMAYYTNYRMRRLGLDLLLDYLYSPPDHDLPPNAALEQLRWYPPEHYRLRRTIHRHTPKGHTKPDPTVLMGILVEVGVGPEDAVYIGDSLMKDVAMAKAASVRDVWAKYGGAQHRPEYELLRRVSHWPDVAVNQEKRLTQTEVKPTFQLDTSFGQLLDLFTFEQYTDRTKEAVSQKLDVWKKTIDVQQHFNDLELRIRNYAVTLLAGLLGAAAFGLKENVRVVVFDRSVSIAAPLLGAGIIGWLAFYFMDRFWYHRLLMGAVKHGSRLEAALRKDIPEIGLTEAIGRESPIPIRLFGKIWSIRSARKMDLFYWVVVALLFLMIVGILTVVYPTPAPAGAQQVQAPGTGPQDHSTSPLVPPTHDARQATPQPVPQGQPSGPSHEKKQ